MRRVVIDSILVCVCAVFHEIVPQEIQMSAHPKILRGHVESTIEDGDPKVEEF